MTKKKQKKQTHTHTHTKGTFVFLPWEEDSKKQPGSVTYKNKFKSNDFEHQNSLLKCQQKSFLRQHKRQEIDKIGLISFPYLKDIRKMFFV